MKKIALFAAFLSLSCVIAGARDYKLSSPDGRTQVTVSAEQDLRWQVSRDGQTVILPSEMSVVLGDGTVLGASPKVRSATITTVAKVFKTPVYHKSEILDEYNLLTLKMKGDYSVEFRAYDSGVAYRFVTARKGDMTVKDEKVTFRFDKDYDTFIPYVNDNRGGERYCYSFESYYTEVPMSKMVDDSLSIVPYIVSLDGGLIYKNYHSDAARTYPVGKITPELEKLIEVTKQSFFEGIKFAYAGNHLNDISSAIGNYAESFGYGVVTDFVGHGIGTHLHEDPEVPMLFPAQFYEQMSVQSSHRFACSLP